MRHQILLKKEKDTVVDICVLVAVSARNLDFWGVAVQFTYGGSKIICNFSTHLWG